MVIELESLFNGLSWRVISPKFTSRPKVPHGLPNYSESFVRIRPSTIFVSELNAEFYKKPSIPARPRIDFGTLHIVAYHLVRKWKLCDLHPFVVPQKE